MGDLNPEQIVAVATAICTALGLIATALSLAIRQVRRAWAESGGAQVEKVAAQRDALIEGHADALAKLELRDPATARLVKDALRQAQIDRGVQSDLAPLVDQAKALTPPPPAPPPSTPA